METYNVSFVFDLAVVSTTIECDDISEVVGLAEDAIRGELGFVLPSRCRVELEVL